MPAGDVYELTIDSTYNAQSIANVLHFTQIGADGGGLGEEAVPAMFASVFLQPWAAMICNTYQFLQSRCRRITPTETQQFVSPINVFGDDVRQDSPTHLTAILRTYGTTTGRKGTGGIKFCGFSIDSYREGRIGGPFAGLGKVLGELMELDQSDVGSGYIFHASVFSRIDKVARQIQKTVMLPRLKTVRSRQLGVVE